MVSDRDAGATSGDDLEAVLARSTADVRPSAEERRLALLLPVDEPDAGAQPEQQLLADVIAHELVHVSHRSRHAMVGRKRPESWEWLDLHTTSVQQRKPRKQGPNDPPRVPNDTQQSRPDLNHAE